MNDLAQLVKARLPRKPYCTDDLENGLQIRSAERAIERRHIQIDPPWEKSWIVMDMDKPNSSMAWEEANLPFPTWTSVNPENGHAHLVWGIENPVLCGDHDRSHPMRYLNVIKSAMADKLGADMSYSGLITKNPLHDYWQTRWAPPEMGLYSLNYLSEWLDLSKRRPVNREDRVCEGRNDETFESIRYLAYANIKFWRGGKNDKYKEWEKWIRNETIKYTCNNHKPPMSPKECDHISRSIAKFTWRNYNDHGRYKRFVKEQAYRGRKSGESRRQAREAERREARLLRDKGMTVRTISKELDIPISTIGRWLSHEPNQMEALNGSLYCS